MINLSSTDQPWMMSYLVGNWYSYVQYVIQFLCKHLSYKECFLSGEKYSSRKIKQFLWSKLQMWLGRSAMLVGIEETFSEKATLVKVETIALYTKEKHYSTSVLWSTNHYRTLWCIGCNYHKTISYIEQNLTMYMVYSAAVFDQWYHTMKQQRSPHAMVCCAFTAVEDPACW